MRLTEYVNGRDAKRPDQSSRCQVQWVGSLEGYLRVKIVVFKKNESGRWDVAMEKRRGQLKFTWTKKIGVIKENEFLQACSVNGRGQ